MPQSSQNWGALNPLACSFCPQCSLCPLGDSWRGLRIDFLKHWLLELRFEGKIKCNVLMALGCDGNVRTLIGLSIPLGLYLPGRMDLHGQV